MFNIEERIKILEDAANIIVNDRVDQYGQPEDCFKYISDLWSLYINEKYDFDFQLEPIDIANMMALLKIARMSGSSSKYKRDNYVDAIGYLAIANSLENKKEEKD